MEHLQNLKFVTIIQPLAIVDNASWTTVEIDTVGWESMLICFMMGANDIAMTALAVTESDTAGSGHTNVTGCIYGTSLDIAGTLSVLPSATDDNKLWLFDLDLRKLKRYIDLTATNGDGSTGGFASCVGVLGRGAIHPTTAALRGATGNILRAA